MKQKFIKTDKGILKRFSVVSVSDPIFEIEDDPIIKRNDFVPGISEYRCYVEIIDSNNNKHIKSFKTLDDLQEFMIDNFDLT